jgi:hypothetical protein
MLKAFEPPAWVREIVVVADAGYPANLTLKLIDSKVTGEQTSEIGTSSQNA